MVLVARFQLGGQSVGPQILHNIMWVISCILYYSMINTILLISVQPLWLPTVVSNYHCMSWERQSCLNCSSAGMMHRSPHMVELTSDNGVMWLYAHVQAVITLGHVLGHNVKYTASLSILSIIPEVKFIWKSKDHVTQDKRSSATRAVHMLSLVISYFIATCLSRDY